MPSGIWGMIFCTITSRCTVLFQLNLMTLVHEQSHFDNRTGTVFFGRVILTQSPDGLAGHLIDIIFIFHFSLKIIVCAVIVTDGSISFYHVTAFFKKIRDIFVIMFSHKIKCTHDMHVVKFWLLIITGHMLE